MTGVVTERCPGGARPSGFTLIELLVTLTLVGFLLMLGLPAFTSMVKNTQVRTVADALQNGIRLARTEALRLNRQTVFSLTNANPVQDAAALAGGRNWALQTVPSAADASSTFVQGGALADVASGVAIAASLTAAPTTSVASICFNSNGRLAANASPGPSGASCAAQNVTYVVTQTSADRPLNVTVTVGGHVRICDPQRSLANGAPDGC